MSGYLLFINSYINHDCLHPPILLDENNRASLLNRIWKFCGLPSITIHNIYGVCVNWNIKCSHVTTQECKNDEDISHGMHPNYEVNRRKAHLSDLTEVSLMGNGKSIEAERQELSGPTTLFNGKYIIPANSCLKPVTVNTKQFALYFTDWLAHRGNVSTFQCHCLHIHTSIPSVQTEDPF